MNSTCCATALRVSLIVGFAALAVAPALAQAQKLDAAKSEILFTSKQMGVPVDGRFKKLGGLLDLAPGVCLYAVLPHCLHDLDTCVLGTVHDSTKDFFEDAVVVERAGLILGHNVLQAGTHVLCHKGDKIRNDRRDVRMYVVTLMSLLWRHELLYCRVQQQY